MSVPPKDPNGVRLAAQMKMPRFSMMERGVEDLGGRWKLHEEDEGKRWVVENRASVCGVCGVCVAVWC